jgi:hypothetical protein
VYQLPAILVATLLALLLAAPPPAAAAPGRVFHDRPQQVLPGRHANMAIEGRVDTARVARGSPLLELQLPDGSNVELARQGFRRLHRDSATWRGTVRGYARSDATLSVVNGRMAGRVRIDADVYEIRPIAENEIRLERLDMDSFPACDGGLPLDPTIPAAADVLVDAGAAQAAAGDEGVPRLDMLVLYTAAAEAKEGAQQIPATVAAAVASLNTVFQNSQVNAEAVLVHAQRIEYNETGYIEALQWLSSDPQVAELRNRYAADMVSLLVDLDSSCGIGWVPRTNAENFNSATAFQVTGIDCAVGNLSFAHESGHNMGMEHNPENSSAGIGQPAGPASYEHSFGHWVAGGANAFRTVMSYADPCGSAFACPREEYFSNPYIDYRGNPTGTLGQPGLVNGRYNALTGNFTAPVIAQYRSPPASSGTRDFVIQQGSDDAQENNSTGQVTDNWVALVTGYYPVSPYPATSVGLRFQNINIPRDATITAAWLEFEAYDNRAGYAATSISVEAADNPATFSAAAPFDISARPRGGSVRWDDIPPWLQGESHQSVDISTLVQATVDREGWQANNAMAFILHDNSGDRWATSFNDPVGAAPRLHIEHRSCSGAATLAGGGQWQSFSLPCLPRDNQLQQVFAGLDGAAYNSSWAVFAHDAASDSYRLLAPTERLQANTGYWYVNTGPDYQLSVSGRERRERDIPLYAAAPLAGNLVGNLVGHTGMANVPWQDVTVVDGERVLSLAEADPELPGLGLACDQQPVAPECVMSRKMYKWNGAAYQGFDGTTPGMEGSLDPFDGVWVAAHKPGISLRLPALAAAAEGDAAGDEPLTGGQPVQADPREWTLRLTVESGEQSDPGNLLGRLATARGGKDAHDLEELPPQGDSWLSLLFLNRAWNAEDNWGYTSDFRRAVRGEPRGTWHFVVKNSGEQREATLRWSGPRKVLKRARLIDKVNHKVIHLHRQDSYTFPLDCDEQRFHLVVRPKHEHPADKWKQRHD